MRVGAAALLAGVLAVPAGAAAAEERASCAAAIDKATADYELGLLEDALAELAPCDERGVGRIELAAAHALRAKALLALDRVDEARAAVAALLRADPSFQAGPPPAFARLVEEARGTEQTPQIASVSKTAESLREAPATVVVVTADEIERRGYLDLEELLHDLPGFDVSRTNGEVYANYYQRGVRSDFNDRNLLLLDGVEQHEPSTNTILLSRQYALSSIDRVEVVYGPASTIYGANAYTGVMSIITKTPEAVAKGRRFGLTAQAASGSFGTRFADVTLGGQTRDGAVAWTASGRVHHSDEFDLSHFSDWDYNYDELDYRSILRLQGPQAAQFCGFQESSPFVCRQLPSPYYRPVFDAQGRLLSVEVTPEGEQVARDLDRQLLARNHFHFTDPTDDVFFYGKLRLSNVTMGLQYHRLKEGLLSTVTERIRPGSEHGALFTPNQIFFYLNFARSVGANLSLHSLTRYSTTEVEREGSEAVFLATYAGTFLGLPNLIQPCPGQDPASPPASCPTEPSLVTFPLDAHSTQLTTELSLAYDPSERLNAIGGFTLSRSFVQADLLDTPKTTRVHDNVAAYLQTSYRPRKALKLVAAGRVDYNRLEGQLGEHGFGTIFSPRLAAVYTPAKGRSVYKAIYAEGFKDPSDGEKFTAQFFVRDLPAGGLEPERVRNFELAGDWQPLRGLSLGMAAYQAEYREVVALRLATLCSDFGCFTGTQLHNIGEATIRGAQAQLHYRRDRGELFGNYTFTHPYQTNPPDAVGGAEEQRIADIASHRLNLGVDVFWRSNLSSDLRVNYVGARKTGAGTTVPTNPFSQIDPYTVASTTLTYRLPFRGSFRNSKVQLIVDNLLDAEVFDPGSRRAGFGFAARVPQPGRRIYLRFLTIAPGRLDAPRDRAPE